MERMESAGLCMCAEETLRLYKSTIWRSAIEIVLRFACLACLLACLNFSMTKPSAASCRASIAFFWYRIDTPISDVICLTSLRNGPFCMSRLVVVCNFLMTRSATVPLLKRYFLFLTPVSKMGFSGSVAGVVWEIGNMVVCVLDCETRKETQVCVWSFALWHHSNVAWFFFLTSLLCTYYGATVPFAQSSL